MILVAGGTGRLGSRVVRRLVAQGEPVRVLSRGHVDVDLPREVELVHGDVRRPADLDSALAGARLVLSAVQGMVGKDVSPASVDRDGNLELVRAAGRAGAEVVLMSVTGASAGHPLEMARMKYAAERALVTGGVPFTVVRAAAFAELWVGIVEKTAGRGRRPLVFGSADRPIWWVSVEDVAEATARAVLDPSYRGRTVEVVGPEGVTLTGLASAVMRARGWPGGPRRVPRVALRVGAATVGRLKPQVGTMLRASLAMDESPPDDPEVTRRDFPGLRPALLEEVLARRSGD